MHLCFSSGARSGFNLSFIRIPSKSSDVDPICPNVESSPIPARSIVLHSHIQISWNSLRNVICSAELPLAVVRDHFCCNHFLRSYLSEPRVVSPAASRRQSMVAMVTRPIVRENAVQFHLSSTANLDYQLFASSSRIQNVDPEASLKTPPSNQKPTSKMVAPQLQAAAIWFPATI